MNQPKKSNNNWVLCPSKRFPGKIYFFNVSTGEAMWCFNDTEKTGLKTRLQDEDHSYPEPSTPPEKASPPRQFPFTPYNGNMVQNTYSPYNPSVKNNMAVSMYMPPFDTNYMRSVMPYQFLPPMMWPPQMPFMPFYGANPSTLGWPVVQETKLIEPTPAGRDIVVHSGKLPLSQRFINYKDPVLKFKDNKIVDPQLCHDLIKSNLSELSHEKSPKKSPESVMLTQNAEIQAQISGGCESDINLTPTFKNKVIAPFANTDENKQCIVSKLLYDPIGPPSDASVKQQTSLEATLQSQNTNLSRPSQKYKFNQSKTSHHIFGQNSMFGNTLPKVNPSKTADFAQIQTDVGSSDQNQTDLNIFSQSGKNQICNMFPRQNKLDSKLFRQNSSNQHNDQDPYKIDTNKGMFGLKINKIQEVSDHIQTNSFSRQNQLNTKGFPDEIGHEEQYYDDISPGCFSPLQNDQEDSNQTQSSFRNLRTDYELNVYHKHVAEKSALKQCTKDEFPVTSDPTTNFEKDVKQNTTFIEGNRVENQSQAELKLDKNDLRRFLLAKKRKSVELSAAVESSVGIKIKTTTRRETTNTATPKKKVTFNPVLDIISDLGTDNCSPNAENTGQEDEEVSQNKYWYAVADTMTLLEKYEAIEQFVKSDPYCSLVIPHSVMSDTVALSRRECPESGLVTRARHLLRTLDSPPTHVMLQMHDDKPPRKQDNYPVLHCCLDIMENSRVVLITNDAYLRGKAEYIGIDCLSTQDIKNYKKTPPLQFDIKKIKISVPNQQENDEKHVENGKNIEFSNSQPKTLDQSRFSSKCLETKSNNNLKSDTFKTNSFFGSNKEYRIPKANKDPKVLNSTFKNGISNLNQAQDSNFENDSNGQQQKSQSSILQTQNKESHLKTSNSEKPDKAVDVKFDLEEFLKRFVIKNMDLEHVSDQKKDEMICSFRQIMEECLFEILEKRRNWLEQVHGMSPPFFLQECLRCVELVYGQHASVRETVHVLSHALDDRGRVPRSEAARGLACAMALVQAVKNITGPAECLSEAEELLNTVLEQARAPSLDLDAHAPRSKLTDLEDFKKRKNFVKDRSEVLQYLKKHYPAWADYDEKLLEDNPTQSWGKSFKDAMVIRMCGKNLSKLTLNNSKPMTITEPDSAQHCNGIATSSPEKKNRLKILKMTQNVDPRIYTKQNAKLTVIVDNSTKENQNTNIEIAKNNQYIDENQNVVEKKTEPKVVRLFSNYNFKKDQKEATNAPKERVVENFETHGHTFGSSELNGPKVLRNIKPIKKFEDKLKFEQKPLDIDEQDYSTMSLTAYDHFVTELNNKKAPETHTKDSVHDHSDLTNDKSYSMSLENSFTNYICDSKNDVNEKDIFDKKNDMIQTNDNLDYMSFDTSGFDEYFGIKDDFKVNSKNNFVQKNDMNGDRNDILDRKDYPSNENVHEKSYRVVDGCLFELKISFKHIHKFIGSSIKCLRTGAASAARRASLRDTALSTQRQLYAIVAKLDRIAHRETIPGRRVKDMFKDTLFENDVRVQNYRQLISKCVDQVVIMNAALKMLLQLTDEQSDQHTARGGKLSPAG